MNTDAKFRYFAIAGAIGGIVASIGYTVWEVGLNQTEDRWGFGPVMVSSTYVVGVGLLATCVAIALTLAQSRYLGHGLVPQRLWQTIGMAAFGGVVGGFVAPYVAASLLDGEDPIRFLGWTLAGAAVGLVVSQAIVNLSAQTALIGGAAGGLLGCIVLYLMKGVMESNLTMGMAATGLSIGVLVAFAERVKRSVWLEVTIKLEGEQQAFRTVELTVGDQPITFGYDRGSDVRLEAIVGGPTAFAIVRRDRGHTIFHDLISRSEHVMTEDSSFNVSNAVVRMKGK